MPILLFTVKFFIFNSIDMNKIDTIENEKLHSKQPLTAFAGRKIKGWPIKTFLRGQLVVDNNKICQDKACGKWIK